MVAFFAINVSFNTFITFILLIGTNIAAYMIDVELDFKLKVLQICPDLLIIFFVSLDRWSTKGRDLIISCWARRNQNGFSN